MNVIFHSYVELRKDKPSITNLYSNRSKQSQPSGTQTWLDYLHVSKGIHALARGSLRYQCAKHR